MKLDQLLTVGLAGVALYMIYKVTKTATPAMSGSNVTLGKPQGQFGISEIFTNATGDQPGAGWRYFNDGTVIDPSGAYYFQGVKLT